MKSSINRSRSLSQVGMLVSRAGIASLAMAAVGSTSHGAIVNWAAAVNGTASTAARWNPVVVPVATDDLVFNATAGVQAYSVTFDAATATSRTLEFNQDTVTLVMNSPHTTTNGFTIADGATDIAVVNLSSGIWTSALSSSTAFNIGNVSGSIGTLNVTDDSADLILSGAGSRIRVGNNGTGTLSITGGGRVEAGEVHLASGIAASNGTLIVSGAQAVSPFQRSTLVCTNTAGACLWGSGNNATATISNGALATLAGDLEVARGSASTTSVTIGGAGGLGGINDATLNVAGSSFVGGNNSATLVGGIGTVTVNNSGRFVTGGTLHVGNDPNGGTGTLNINLGALVDSGIVIDGANGIINHTGGTLRINGGTYSGHPIPLVVSGTGGPTLQYSNNSVNNLPAAGGVGLRVGDDLGVGTFSGNLIIDSGADVVMTGLNNDINIGDDAGTTGVITVTGSGSRLIDNQPGDLIRVGFNGTGDLYVESGGQVLATEIQVPASSLGGSGRLFMNDPVNGGPIVTVENLSVGNAAGLGTGLVTINEGIMNVTNPGVGVVVRDTGVLLVTDFTALNAAGSINIDGGVLQVNGTVNAGTLVDVLAGGEVQGSPGGGVALVISPVHVRSGGAVQAVNGDLTIGDPNDPTGIALDTGSSVTVGAGRTLTLRTMNGQAVNANGAINMQGGVLAGQQILMDGNAADQISGFGTIDTNVRTSNIGICAPTGTGLRFLKEVLLNGGFDVSGTVVQFGPESLLRDLSGTHAFSCRVVADAGSEMRPGSGNGGSFGPITMGDGTASGVTLNGTIHMGTNGSLTLNDLNGVALGSLTDMNGGTISCTNGLSVSTGRVLRGRGTIDVPNPGSNGFTLNGGTIDPDAYDVSSDTYAGIASFTVNGRYTQQATGTYLCEIAGVNNEFQPLNDRISCGPAVLNGVLDVSLINGYEPQLCDEFTIMTYASRTGVWATIIEPPGVDVGIRYEATRAVLFFNSVECNDIDFNNDGALFDPTDIDAYLSVFSEGPCIPADAVCDDIDFNNDCSLFDPQDIDAFLSVFSEGPCNV